MTPELREFVLSLPLDVRRELLKCEGPCWFLYGNTGKSLATEPDRDDPLEGHETRTGPYRLAYLPISPIAIALHAAKLSGRDGSHLVSVSVSPCFSFGHSSAWMSSNPSPRAKDDVYVEHEDMTDDDTAKDPTGHRAAIALLQKVMAEKVTP